MCVGGEHTGVFVSMPLCMDVSVCACQHVSKRLSPPQRDVNSK